MDRESVEGNWPDGRNGSEENAAVGDGGQRANGNYWKCAGGGVLLGGRQRGLHLFIFHKLMD